MAGRAGLVPMPKSEPESVTASGRWVTCVQGYSIGRAGGLKVGGKFDGLEEMCHVRQWPSGLLGAGLGRADIPEEAVGRAHFDTGNCSWAGRARPEVTTMESLRYKRVAILFF